MQDPTRFDRKNLDLVTLRSKGLLPENSVIVNGQTGDFISGGHIPHDLSAGLPITAHQEIIKKHCSLWPSHLTDTNLNKLHECLLNDTDDPCNFTTGRSREGLAALFERWEYEERQAKFIINGQRAYDFLGLRWRLPLWHLDVVKAFFSTPLDLRMGQTLYRQYLKEWDYAGLFTEPRPPLGAWTPLMSSIFVPVSILTRLVAGRGKQKKLTQYLRYFDRYGNHYGSFGLQHFLRHAHDARNAFAFYAAAWLDERAGTALNSKHQNTPG